MYSKAMFNTALRIVNKVADAEDLLQDAFIDAFLQLKTFEHKSTFGAWLKQIVIFKCINFLKKKRIGFMDMADSIEAIPAETDMDETALHYTVDSIKQSILKLPDGYRTVLSLYLLEGYDHEEIAEILGVTQSTVRTQYMRGKQKLLQMFKNVSINE